MADSAQAPVQEHWSETNGKKYRRGSRLPKKTDTRPPVPAAETPKVPWTWEEDGMTVIRGTARSAPGCHNVCGILSYVKDGKLVKVEGDPEDPYNQGRLCSRCLCIPDYVYHEDRLIKPMKRDRADRGKDKFVECSAGTRPTTSSCASSSASSTRTAPTRSPCARARAATSIR
ncbi:MAG: hypothetical protein V8S24_00650 [Gordonibacter pamelaeae]